VDPGFLVQSGFLGFLSGKKQKVVKKTPGHLVGIPPGSAYGSYI